MDFESTDNWESHLRCDVVSMFSATFISDTRQARSCCMWKDYRPPAFHGINYFRKKIFTVNFCSTAIPKVSEIIRQVEKMNLLKMEETGNVAFVKSRAYSVAFRISFQKCSRHYSCCSLQLWGKKKKTISFLLLKRSLRFTQSQTFTLADGTRLNCEGWRCWFWCHFCPLRMQSCCYQRHWQLRSHSGQGLQGG